MAIVQCPQGHLYDTGIYQSCPYCAGNSNMIIFDQPNRTAAPSGYGGGSGYSPAPNRTMPIGSGYDQQPGRTAPSGGGYGAAPNRTVPIQSGSEGAGKTVIPESYRKKQAEENKTVSVFSKTHNLEPVVGWLACVAGPERGKSYELFAKINTIGRNSENDVSIQSDDTISRKSHARIAYDPKHNDFRLIPDESTNNVYLNDEPIYTPTIITAYNLIEIGKSKLVFVPLCSEYFRWKTDGQG